MNLLMTKFGSIKHIVQGIDESPSNMALENIENSKKNYYLHCFQISCWIMYHVKIWVVIGLLSSVAMGM